MREQKRFPAVFFLSPATCESPPQRSSHPNTAFSRSLTGSARPSLPGPGFPTSLLSQALPASLCSDSGECHCSACPEFTLLSLATASLQTSADRVQHLLNQLPSLSGLGFVVYYCILTQSILLPWYLLPAKILIQNQPNHLSLLGVNPDG